MTHPFPISAVIVADEIIPEAASGNDQDKSNLYKDIPQLFEMLFPFYDEIIIVAADPLDFLAHDALIVRLHQDKQGPLGAMYAGLFAARHQQALVVHCRMPVTDDASMITQLVNAAEPRFDALVTASNRPGLFPAVYHKRCLKILAQLWAKKSAPPTIESFFKQIRIHTLSE